MAEVLQSAASLIAAVETGRDFARVSQSLNYIAEPRLKVRQLDPAPPPLVVGLAYRCRMDSKATDALIAAAR